MTCEWHFNCTSKVACRIKLPTGFVYACERGRKEFRDLYPGARTQLIVPLKPESKTIRRYADFTDEQVASLGLTRKEQKELDSMPADEADAVIRFLLSANSTKHKGKITT